MFQAVLFFGDHHRRTIFSSAKRNISTATFGPSRFGQTVFGQYWEGSRRERDGGIGICFSGPDAIF